ncbi:MAG: TonB-dependent receptor [Deltaproteobacteria bacterium]|nr:TonB-dependent receptor [Deltaproteobacteria bacterium]
MKPESAWEYEIGAIHDIGPFSVRGALYYYDIQDFINDNGITSPGTGIGSDCLYNIPHFKLYGGEIEASIRLGRFLGTVSYNYQNYTAESAGFEQNWTYYLPALLPQNKVKLLCNYEVWEGGLVQFSSIFVDERKTQQPGTEDLDSYITFDIGFQQGFKWMGLDWMAELYCNNFTGANYEEQAGYKMPKYVSGVLMSVRF